MHESLSLRNGGGSFIRNEGGRRYSRKLQKEKAPVDGAATLGVCFMNKIITVKGCLLRRELKSIGAMMPNG